MPKLYIMNNSTSFSPYMGAGRATRRAREGAFQHAGVGTNRSYIPFILNS